MLILTRKTDQGIVIQGTIVVRVLAVEGERVKIGISAPASVLVLREELCEAVQQENRLAATGAPGGLTALRASVTALPNAAPRKRRRVL